jgi:hypothetical protein
MRQLVFRHRVCQHHSQHDEGAVAYLRALAMCSALVVSRKWAESKLA